MKLLSLWTDPIWSFAFHLGPNIWESKFSPFKSPNYRFLICCSMSSTIFFEWGFIIIQQEPRFFTWWQRLPGVKPQVCRCRGQLLRSNPTHPGLGLGPRLRPGLHVMIWLSSKFGVDYVTITPGHWRATSFGRNPKGFWGMGILFKRPWDFPTFFGGGFFVFGRQFGRNLTFGKGFVFLKHF